MKHLFFLLCFFKVFTGVAATNEMRYADKIRIKEAITISSKVGDKLWKDINAVPFVVLLVTDSTEFLINHPYPSADFKSLGYDSVLNTAIFSRERKFPNWYLATFPAVNGVTCIVVGTPENTRKTSSEWVITLVHEHFHQYQFSSPGYFQQVNDLDLSGGDETGMWQLNYAFPYDSAIVEAQYERYTKALAKTVSSINTKKFKEDLKVYQIERRKFEELLKPTDYRYFSFQLWQEGLARYTEYKYLRLLVDYTPSKEMAAFPDYIPFTKLAGELYDSEMKALIEAKLSKEKRICFYPTGFAEGLLLDELDPAWRNNYLKKKFFIEKYLPGE